MKNVPRVNTHIHGTRPPSGDASQLSQGSPHTTEEKREKKEREIKNEGSSKARNKKRREIEDIYI